MCPPPPLVFLSRAYRRPSRGIVCVTEENKKTKERQNVAAPSRVPLITPSSSKTSAFCLSISAAAAANDALALSATAKALPCIPRALS